MIAQKYSNKNEDDDRREEKCNNNVMTRLCIITVHTSAETKGIVGDIMIHLLVNL